MELNQLAIGNRNLAIVFPGMLVDQGIDTFVEAGPGKVLSGLMRPISSDAKTMNVEDAASLETARAALAARNSLV